MKNIISKKLAVMLSLPLFLLMIGTAKAETVTFDFSGTVAIITDTYGDLAAAGIQSGVTAFSGTVVYDTTTPSHAYNSTYGYAEYWSSSYTINIGGGFSWTKLPNNGQGITVQDNRTIGSSTYDMFEVAEDGYATFNSKNVWMGANVWMRDDSLLSLSSLDLPTASILNNFNIDATHFRMIGYDNGQRAWDIGAVASSVEFSVRSVPEPATILLLGSGLVGLGLFRKRFKG